MNFNKLIKIFIHIIFWSIFLVIPHLMFDLPLNNMHRFIYIFSLIIIFFYLNTYVFIPFFLTKRKFFLFIVSIIGSIIISIFLTSFIASQFPQIKYPVPHKFRDSRFHSKDKNEYLLEDIEEEPEKSRIGQIVFTLLFTFAISTSIRVTRDYYKNEKQKEEIEKEKLASEISLLKSQVNPHFLFNTLNGIYSIANKESTKTADAIVKLSNLMRYMLYEADKELVNLTKEIDYIINYIDLQKLRLFDNVKIKLEIQGDFEKETIEPMLLIPFIENAFKHGIDNEMECIIDINLKCKQGKLEIKVANSIIDAGENVDKISSGIGLKNVKERLYLLYPNNHSLSITEKNNIFMVNLLLKLKKDELHHS